MEEINSKKTEAFLTAIKTLADEECKSIDEETDRLRVERLRALQKEAEDRYKSYTEYETARIKADCNSAVSECEERSRKELTDLRAELCKKVFDAAGEKINEYTKTDSYREKACFIGKKRLPRLLTAGMLSCFYAKRISCFPTISRRYLKTVVS